MKENQDDSNDCRNTYCYWKILQTQEFDDETSREWSWESKRESGESLQREEPEGDDGGDDDEQRKL